MSGDQTSFIELHKRSLGNAVKVIVDGESSTDDIAVALVGVLGSALGALAGPSGAVLGGIGAAAAAKRVLSKRSQAQLAAEISAHEDEEKQREAIFPLVQELIQEIQTVQEEVRATQDLSIAQLKKLDEALRVLSSIREEISSLKTDQGSHRAPLSPGLELGPYKLKKQLGTGTFAQVWLASLKTRDVTLKILHLHHSDDPTGPFDRFERGAEALKRLSHQRIPKVVATHNDRSDKGYLFYAYHFVPGENLEACISHLTPAQALHVIHDAGSALVHAHDKGIIHRDVKPGNIVVKTADKPEGFLVDFDLVRDFQNTGGTGFGASLGTHIYMPPEAYGRASSMDVRSDVYSLGMTTLFVLLRRNPAPDRGERLQEIEELGVANSLKAVIERALEKDPDDRFQSVSTFLAKLERACDLQVAQPFAVDDFEGQEQENAEPVNDRRFECPELPAFPSAIVVDDLDDWASCLGLVSAQRVMSHLLTGNIKGIPTSESLSTMWNKIPELRQVLDIPKIEDRLNHLPEMTAVQRFLGKLTSFAPEFREIKKACGRAVEAASCSSVERAESWLVPIAENAVLDADLEASIYFRSRGRSIGPAGSALGTVWKALILREVIRYKPTGHEDAIGKAERGELSLSEAATVLRIYGLRFFDFGHDVRDFIDATLLRAIQWLNVEGFDPWRDAAVEELSGGRESVDLEEAWHFFHMLRADLSFECAQRSGLETWIWRMSRGTHDALAPWRQLSRWPNTDIHVDIVPYAAILVFAWVRIQPNLDSRVFDKALEFLMACQLDNGAWPVWVGSAEPNLGVTCTVVHALALAKPTGWLLSASKATAWIEGQQDGYGCWHIQGGPTVMLTVLALDSLSLGAGHAQATFSVPSD